ncbi:phosphatase PAP2 family protein [Flavobacterium hibernum]|uniref:PA-phosphatase n=1 Tax=Flavobacterium hibernum TaxID=37752 RepID=A0A0D0EWU2_9FLAO|nr:phosphatase PAP2 family protein [Flavobacterium hibernum]KIO53453.1 PA-phosphatase [Flavobacterium hibernum]OXA88057.1 phosphatase PAP2 family protein [Flavobacterium hibernum]STO10666.1 PAP2 (acid phosphatase) superfamily protein [Flavobacterium hibernum]
MFKSILLFLVSITAVSAQNSVSDSIVVRDTVQNLKFNYKQLIIPGVLIGYGFIGLESDQLKSFNTQIRDEVKEDIDNKITIDDFSQYAPAASVYALNAMGIEGKNNLKDRSIILATSYLIMSTTVFSLKHITKVERPDGTSNNSFPSGHTANAFAGAEFLWQEYKDKSIWYGISGYIVATGTGLFRMYNNRHWLTDVAAGAGIGILSTKAAYWLFPYVKNTIFPSKENKVTSMIMPFYNGKQMGAGMVVQF